MSQSNVRKLYGCLESNEVSLGGGGGFEGFYGSVTASGVSKVYSEMTKHCDFGSDSFLVDIGGGVGRPLMHALLEPGLKNAVGIEVDEIKCMKSESIIHEACKKLQGTGLTVPHTPLVIHRDIEKVNQHGTLDPATHAYTFWEGVPSRARKAFGELFAKSSTLQCVAIVQRAIRKQTPEALMASYGFCDLELKATVKSVQMSGSNRSFTGYVFQRAAPLARPFSGDSSLLLSSILKAPRLRQVTMPRLLRSRRGTQNIPPPTTQQAEGPHKQADAPPPAKPLGLHAAQKNTQGGLPEAKAQSTAKSTAKPASKSFGLAASGIGLAPQDRNVLAAQPSLSLSPKRRASPSRIAAEPSRTRKGARGREQLVAQTKA